ncbi:hypothetical protein [Microbacterium trichothecenolyticum]|uniref:Integral membrane protein n=1 Tax=Microbacterium trichothecenolyticum TaxID=69370 RepID=A0ABU0TUU2_MICTR|nr:hypothetical protein [Microbacterium trichothecenolyticum]MDQ1123426.1 hypothetical protein [Microbacterium trichothecenolyticum]
MLLLGGADPDGYSSSYLITMAFGVLVGVVVNLVVVPPLRVQRADDRLGRLRDDLGRALRGLAESLPRHAFDPASADAASAGVTRMLADVREEVDLADESRRYNPRSRRLRAPRDLNRRRLDALAAAADATRELSSTLARLTAAPESESRLPDDARRVLGSAIGAASHLVTAADPGSVSAQLRDAERALALYTECLRSLAAEPLDAWEAAVNVRRVLTACGPLADATAR